MGKKAKLYLLIVVNLIAWGYVGYRIYIALQGDDDIPVDMENVTIKKMEETKKEDSVILTLNYQDPFLKGVHFSHDNKKQIFNNNNFSNNIPKPVASVKPVKPELVPVTLDIKYVGIVKNNDKGTQTAMISINGKSYFVKPKDVIDNLLIQEISSDFIKIKKGKELLIINK